tara:strand:- start:2713 stop:3069 length:357 start_codon:yes stop_codon:yes gene_type:complete
MATAQFTLENDPLASNGTSNLMSLLKPHQQQALRLVMPRDVERVFGRGQEIDIPSKGYTDPEWYFQSSDGCVWGIGWRWGQPRLRGRGSKGNGLFANRPSSEQAEEFLGFLLKELVWA